MSNDMDQRGYFQNLCSISSVNIREEMCFCQVNLRFLHSRGRMRQAGKPTLHRGETFANRADYKQGNLRYKHVETASLQLRFTNRLWSYITRSAAMAGFGCCTASKHGEVCSLTHLVINLVTRWWNSFRVEHMTLVCDIATSSWRFIFLFSWRWPRL